MMADSKQFSPFGQVREWMKMIDCHYYHLLVVVTVAVVVVVGDNVAVVVVVVDQHSIGLLDKPLEHYCWLLLLLLSCYLAYHKP